MADCGVSLSEAEASIAAPFTSQIPNISCMIKVLRGNKEFLKLNKILLHFLFKKNSFIFYK
jgi:hypothetical protein